MFKIEITDAATFNALYDALAQFCDNQRDHIDHQDEPDENDVSKLEKAEALLESMDLHRIRRSSNAGNGKEA